jgi:rubrerythrin
MNREHDSRKPHLNVPGFNGTFLADLLSACMMHETCGALVYQAVESRTKNPLLKSKYQEFGKETHRHAEILKQLIIEGGGEPTYISPTAETVQAQDTALLKATTSLQGVDLLTLEVAMLDAVFVAEAVDHANWEALAKLSADMQGEGFAAALKRAVQEVEPQEDEHLTWAKETRMKLIRLLAHSTAAQAGTEKLEETVARHQEALR